MKKLVLAFLFLAAAVPARANDCAFDGMKLSAKDAKAIGDLVEEIVGLKRKLEILKVRHTYWTPGEGAVVIYLARQGGSLIYDKPMLTLPLDAIAPTIIPLLAEEIAKKECALNRMGGTLRD